MKIFLMVLISDSVLVLVNYNNPAVKIIKM